ncbi:MAG TPA: hypothetical protein VHM02_08585 [Thermoanaerobaculia bacterium]|nr:hypothetical protein [Thermoanaerobaculia bacterium]
MPKQKDFKRLARTRMEKTGESYTTARAQLLAKKPPRGADAEPTDAPPPAASAPAPDPSTYATLAGVSDETVREKTGRDWRRWVEALDDAGAGAWSHGEIASHVHESLGVSGWWSQSVTVGYERIKGRREIGQRLSGSYEASKSKTVPASLETVRRGFEDAALRARWLPDAEPKLRKTTSAQSLRIDWEDGTAVDVWLTAKGDAKTQVAIVHKKLASKEDAAARKAYWGERLAALAEVAREAAGR